MTLVIAHRGASAAHPENSLEAFRAAAEMGADWVELDVRHTACGEIVVHHDPVTPDGALIRQQSLGDLPDAIPTLAQAIEACGDMGVNIEIKNDPGEDDFDPEHLMVPRVVEIARSALARDRVLVTSFDMGAINAVHDIAPTMPTGFLTMDDIGAEVSVGRATAHNHAAINPWDGIATPRWVAEALEAELDVYVWTVDDPGRMVELAEMGVTGVITNVPDVALAALR